MIICWEKKAGEIVYTPRWN